MTILLQLKFVSKKQNQKQTKTKKLKGVGKSYSITKKLLKLLWNLSLANQTITWHVNRQITNHCGRHIVALSCTSMY